MVSVNKASEQSNANEMADISNTMAKAKISGFRVDFSIVNEDNVQIHWHDSI